MYNVCSIQYLYTYTHAYDKLGNYKCNMSMNMDIDSANFSCSSYAIIKDFGDISYIHGDPLPSLAELTGI